jgi:type II secretory pathway pseudopilin PulG
MPIANCQMPIEKRQPNPRGEFTFGLRRAQSSRTWHSAFGICPRPAFTLVELMLSLALVLLLIIGINYVFRSATDAVSAGQTLNSINTDSQATQPLLFDDLRNASKNPPCFIIASQLVTQFLNSDDAKTSSDPTIIVTDNAGSQVKIANSAAAPYVSSISPAILNNRNHRADLLKFFAHANYHRRSGNDGTYIGTESSDDAYIELGHAALPANDLSNFFGPTGLPTIPSQSNAFGMPGVPRLGAYASDWVLGRRDTLLESPWQNPTLGSPQPITAGDYYYATIPSPALNTPPYGLGYNVFGTTVTQFGANMSPLSYGTVDYCQPTPPGNPTPTEGVTQSQSSRYDIAGATPDQFDRIIANAILNWQAAGYFGPSLWWNPLVYSFPIAQTTGTGTVGTVPQYSQTTTTPYVVPYYQVPPQILRSTQEMYTSPLAPRGRGFVPVAQFADPGLWLNRPQCNPLIQTPVTAAALAEMAPYFLQHCSQFVVEYAGDYMQQDNNPPSSDANAGNMLGLGPDGQIDYYLDANGNKHIRWYGMPRSSTGTPHLDGLGTTAGDSVLIRGYDNTKDKAASIPATGLPINYFTDVIPLRDYYTMWFNSLNNNTLVYSPPWEVDVNFDPSRDYGAYFNPTTNSVANVPAANASANNNAFNGPFATSNPPRYVAAWHDDVPAMVRILIKVDDPNNKVKDGPWYEYVFRLK